MPHRTSSLVAFDNCPAQYRLLRDNPEIENTSTAMERGTAVHKAAEVYLKSLYAGDSEAKATQRAREAVEALRTTLSGAALQEALWFLDRLFDQELPKPAPTEKWFVEHFFMFDEGWSLTEDEEECAFHGTIDLLIVDAVTGEVRIFDWKTSREVEPLSELRVNLQLGVSYPFAGVRIAESVGVTPTQVVVGRQYIPVATLQKFNIPMEEVADAPRKLRARMDAIGGATEFPPKPGSGCFYCPAIRLCDAAKAAGTAESAITDAASAKVAWERAVLQEALAEDAKTRVRAYIAQNGPVPLGVGKTLDLKAVEKRVVKDGVFDILRETRGVDDATMLKYASIGVAALERLVRKDADAMAACVDVRSESRLTVVKEGK